MSWEGLLRLVGLWIYFSSMNLASRFVYRTFRIPFVFSYKVDFDFATIQRSDLDSITVTGCGP